jgi:hypothetical protein
MSCFSDQQTSTWQLPSPRPMSSGIVLQQRHHTSLGPLCPSNPPAVNAASVPSLPAQLALARPLTTPGPTPPWQVRRLTPAELAECHRQGLCFICDEIYVRVHRCAWLYFIEADNYDQDGSMAG